MRPPPCRVRRHGAATRHRGQRADDLRGRPEARRRRFRKTPAHRVDESSGQFRTPRGERTRVALEALNKSLQFSPRNAQALAVHGFLLSAENRPRLAVESFERAIAADSALANGWLGRGLCRIKEGQAEAGRADLLAAAALEPQRAVLRSYLGKALWDAGEDNRAATSNSCASRRRRRSSR